MRGRRCWPFMRSTIPPFDLSSMPAKRTPAFVSKSAWLKRIAIVTTSRADAGIYGSLLEALAAQPDWRTFCLAGGNHHSASFGNTADALPQLRRMEIVPVEHFVDGDRPQDVARTAGQAVIEFSKALAQCTPDLVFVLGDRTEMLAAAMAAVIHRIPIAHLHGGDTTLGAYDEQCRHAITKLSHLHFPALAEHARRIEAMGEEARRIRVVGALALDGLRGFQPVSAAKFSDLVRVDFSKPTIVAAFHPETMSSLEPEQQVLEFLRALEPLSLNILLIGPNADVGHAAIEKRMRSFAEARRGRVYVPSMTQADFWNSLIHAAALIGNSSAGIIEAASFRLPVVNIGDRQRGRIRPRNVIDAGLDRSSILDAIEKALAPTFRAFLGDLTNPYGDGRSAERILSALRALPARTALLRKK